MGVKPSCRLASTILQESVGSLRRRYYEISEKIGDLSLGEIIEKYDLGTELKELLIKAGIIEEESIGGLGLNTYESLYPIFNQRNIKVANKK